MSFDYHNLKKIEKPIFRRQSLAASAKESTSPSKKKLGLVKFDEKPEEIKIDENEEHKPQVKKNENEKKTQKKSILKNTCFGDNLELVKIFLDQEYYKELIEQLNKECGGNQDFLREKMPGFYYEFSMKKFGEKCKEGVVKMIKVLRILNYFFSVWRVIYDDF
jgi:hypothetical protein